MLFKCQEKVLIGDIVELIPDTTSIGQPYFIVWHFQKTPKNSTIGDSSLSPTNFSKKPSFEPDASGEYILKSSFIKPNGLPVLNQEGNPRIKYHDIVVLDRSEKETKESKNTLLSNPEIISKTLKDTLETVDKLVGSEILIPKEEIVVKISTNNPRILSSQFTEIPKKGKYIWAIQIVATQTWHGCWEEIETLKRIGIGAFHQYTNHPTHPWRIRVGNFHNYEKVENAKIVLEEILEHRVWIDYARHDF